MAIRNSRSTLSFKRTRKEKNMYQLPAELVINSVSELKASLLELLSKQSSIELDVSLVARADTASLQILCSLQKNLAETQQQIIWHGKSDALFAAAKTLGVQDFLALSE